MKIKERKKKILAILEEQKKVSIATLSKLLNIPEVTIRRNVRELEKEGKLKREHGFAVYQPEVTLPKHVLDLDSVPSYIFEIAGTVIDKLVKPSMTIWLGDGGISYEIARQIKNVFLVTNSLKIAMITGMLPSNGVKVTLLGQYLEKENLTLTSPSLLAEIEKQNTQIVFVEADGFDSQNVMARADKADIFRKIMEVKKRKAIALLRPDLFGEHAESIVSEIRTFDKVVSEYTIYSYIPSEDRQEFKSIFSDRTEALILTTPKIITLSDYKYVD